MIEWKAAGGRITLLPTSPTASPPLPSAPDLYRRVWGADPDSYQRQENALLPTIARGKRSGIVTICSVHPSRIDFNFMPVPPAITVRGARLALIGDTNQLHAELTQLIEIIGKVGISNSISRVALNLQFRAIRTNIAEANKALTSVIPNEYGVNITNEQDFIFQINRPYISSKVKDVTMNHITKWSVDRLQLVSISIPIGGMPISVSPGTQFPKYEEFIAASVTLDNNNVPKNTLLNGEQQSSLLREGIDAIGQTQRDIGLSIEGF